MRYTPEFNSELITQAMELVTNCPRVGQVSERVYIGRQPSADRRDEVVDLTAVWEGAGGLAKDPAVRCIVLGRNPNLSHLAGATVLRIDRETPEGDSESFDITDRLGEQPILDPNRARLAHTVLGNIIVALSQ